MSIASSLFFLSLLLFVSIPFCFLWGLNIGKKRNLGKIEWIETSALQKNINYLVCGMVRIHSNFFAVILEKSPSEIFCICASRFTLPDPMPKVVKLSEDGTEFVPVFFGEDQLFADPQSVLSFAE